MRNRLLQFLALAAMWPVAAHSQRPVVVRVRVLDSLRVPVVDASVSIVRGLKDVLASGATDRNGSRTLQFNERTEFQVVARKVGYLPATQVLARITLDTVPIELTLRRIPARLDTVRVTAQQSLKKQRLTIGADDIANSSRWLNDATDIVAKLRPDMVYGGSGAERYCPPAQFVWVNGRRIEYPPPNFMMEAKKRDFEPEPLWRANIRASSGLQEPTRALGAAPSYSMKKPNTAYVRLSIDVLSVLASIKPEHIESMEMHDCTDHTVNQRGGEAAIFVTLKDGVHFQPGIGSYAASATAFDSLLKSITIPARLAAARAEASAPTQLEPWRLRLLGVYDTSTGAPVIDADVLDVATGTHTLTTETGTVLLGFLLPGANHIIVSKAGFRPDTLAVSISTSDTLPITHLLKPSGP